MGHISTHQPRRIRLYIDPGQEVSKEVLKYVTESGWIEKIEVIETVESDDMTVPRLDGAIGPNYGDSIISVLEHLNTHPETMEKLLPQD